MLVTALLLGLLGSFHCVGMCGPIAFLLPLHRSNPTQRVVQIIAYHSGRLFMYSLLGLFLGILGERLQLFGFQQQVSITIGVLMILTIIVPMHALGKFNVLKPVYRLVSKLKTAMGGNLKKRTIDGFFTMGLLNGMLPCGLVYMAVLGAIANSNPWNGALYMAFFGLGTVPLMTSAIYLGNFLSTTVKQRVVKAIPVAVVIIGLLFILRGMGLGIPYVSPASATPQHQITAQELCH